MQDKGTWVLPGVLEGTRGSRVGVWLTPKVTQPRSDRAGRELRLLLPAQRDRKPGLRDGGSLVEPWLRSQERLALGAWVRSLHLSLPPFPLQKEDGSTCVENFQEIRQLTWTKHHNGALGKGNKKKKGGSRVRWGTVFPVRTDFRMLSPGCGSWCCRHVPV